MVVFVHETMALGHGKTKSPQEMGDGGAGGCLLGGGPLFFLFCLKNKHIYEG